MAQQIYLIGLVSLLVGISFLFTANGNVLPSQSSTARNVSLSYYGFRGFPYDCSGKRDGNYRHPDPKMCTHFVSCVGRTHAYEMPCAVGNQDGSLLHFDPCADKCDFPHIARCNLPCDL